MPADTAFHRLRVRTASVTEQIAACLADEIIHRRIDDGDRIAEQQWARELEVSRGSLREALLLLERWHLVELQPRRGARVTALSQRWAGEIAQAWFLILRAVVSWLGEHGNASHRQLFEDALKRLVALEEAGDLEAFYEAAMQLALDATEATGHRVYSEMMRNLMPAARRCFYFALIHSPDQTASTIEFVAALRNVLDSGDAAQAARIIHEFEETELARIRHALTQPPGPGAR